MKRRLLLSVFLPLLLAGAAQAQQNRAPLPQAFRAPAGNLQSPDFLWHRGVVRVQQVSFDSAQFDRSAAKRFQTSRGQGAAPALHTEMNFFSDARLSVTWSEPGQTDDYRSVIWNGSVDGFPLGHAVMVVSDFMTSANVSTGDGRMFQIRGTVDGTTWVREVDTLHFPPDEASEGPVRFQVPAAASATNPAADSAADSATADDGAFIDVMVLYTPAVTTKAGGANAIQQQVQLSVAETNLGYQNSGVIQRLRLVYSGEVQYTESGVSDEDLQRLLDPADGYLDVAHRLRNTYSADLVSLWVGQLGDACGLAADILSPSRASPEKGFNVVDYSCATTNLSFAHELGHLMGAAHDRDHTTPNSGAYAYSYGFAQNNAPNKFRTVMAYPASCNSCPRLNFWSNPTLTHTGYPLGNSLSAADATANYLTLNNTRAIVANFRTSQGTGGTPGLPESDHPYTNNLDRSYSYTLPGSPAALNVTFDPRTAVENGYDFLYVADGRGIQIAGSPFTGTSLAGRTIAVPGDTVKIRIVSDQATTDYGLKVTSITGTGGGNTNLPKLAVTSLTHLLTVTLGNPLSNGRVALINQGSAAGAFRVGFYFSQKLPLTTNDLRSTSTCSFANGLAAGAVTSCSGDIAVPASVIPGRWYVAAIADDLNQLTQSDRAGNIHNSDSGQITVTGGVPAELQRPIASSILSSSTELFQWTAGIGVTSYTLNVGSRAGGNDLFARDMGTALSVTVSGLPTNGSTLYITLYSKIGGNTQSRAYSVLSANIAPVGTLPKLAVTSFKVPVTGQVGGSLPASSVTVVNQGTGNAAAFRIGYYFSKTPGITTRDQFSGWYCNLPEGLAAGSSVTCTGDIGIPSTLAGGTWFIAAIADDQAKLRQSDASLNIRNNDNGSLSLTGKFPASLLSPPGNSTLTSSGALFRWDAGSGADQYYLKVGLSQGSAEYCDCNQSLSLSATVTGLPTDGRALYARLYTRFGSDWLWNDYNLRAFNAGVGGLLPRLTVTSFNVPSTGAIGATLQGMKVVVTNQGDANAGPFRLGFYYSTKANITTSDTFSGWFCNVDGGLAAGNSYSCGGEIGIPNSLTPAQWYVAAIADDLNQVQQSTRAGSVRLADTGQITVMSGGGASGGALPESDHPYLPNTDKSWTYRLSGNPASIRVAFSASTYVEDDYDFISVYDSSGRQIAGSPFTGSSLSGAQLTLSGSSVRIRLTSDATENGYGFKVLSVTEVGQLPKLVVTSFSAATAGVPGGTLGSMTMTVQNQGGTDAGPFEVEFYMARHDGVTTKDIDTGWYCDLKNGLAAGASLTCSGQVGIPPNLPPGTWYLAAIADDLFEVEQSDRSGTVRNNERGLVTVTSAGDAQIGSIINLEGVSTPIASQAKSPHP